MPKRIAAEQRKICKTKTQNQNLGAEHRNIVGIEIIKDVGAEILSITTFNVSL